MAWLTDMRLRRRWTLLVCAGALVLHGAGFGFGVPGGAGGRLSAANGAIRGRVELPASAVRSERRPAVTQIGGSSSHPTARREDIIDQRISVVYLERAPRGAFGEPDERHVRMDQRDERFVPHVLAIPVGSTVDFPNNDRTYHNVFSLSDVRTFDLGRYAAGHSKAVRFDRPGIVRVFCDIHSHMSAFIFVFAHRYFAITDAEGRYRMDSVPPGTYTVSVWNETTSVESRQITVPDGGEVELDFAPPRGRAGS
jgi:plastocyanin